MVTGTGPGDAVLWRAAAAEDLTAAVFLQAWRRRGEVVLAGDSALPWLLGVARQLARNAARSRLRYRAALNRAAGASATAADGGDPAELVTGRGARQGGTVNPHDEQGALLPAAPASQELPRGAQHRADLLVAIAAEAGSGRSRRFAPRRWLLPMAAAAAVVVVAVLAVLVPHLAGGEPAQPGTRSGGGPGGGGQLTAPRHWTVPAAGLRAVTADTTSGSVTVTGAATATLTITPTPRYQGTAPTLISRVADGTLSVTARCPQEPRCDVSITVVMPAGLAARAHADQGEVTVSKLSGPVTASANQGDISLSALAGAVTATAAEGNIGLNALTGPVAARTSQGQIDAVGLAGKTVALSSAQGDIDALFWAPPGLVTAATGEGSVVIRLPSTVTYQVFATCQVGSTSVTVPQSGNSPHVVNASTDVGSVTVTG